MSECLEKTKGFVVGTQAFFGSCAVLSFISSVTIIIYFYCCCCNNEENDEEEPEPKDTQSNRHDLIKRPLRFIICSIALANMIGAMAHVWGITTKYEVESLTNTTKIFDDSQCGAQAMLAIFSVLAYFAWITLLIWYTASSTTAEDPKKIATQTWFFIYNILCWGIPFVVAFGAATSGALGYQQGVDIGWCYVHLNFTKESKNKATLILTYELWAFITMALCLIILIPISFRVCIQACRNQKTDNTSVQSKEQTPLMSQQTKSNNITLHNKQVKLMLAAGLLLCMRIPSTVIDLILISNDTEGRQAYYCKKDFAAGFIISGFGSTIQGLVQFVLFVWCNHCRCTCKNKGTENGADKITDKGGAI